MGATRDIADWASTVRYEDIPERVHDRAKAQILSVVGAIHAGRHSEGAMAAHDVVKTWGRGDECTVFATGDKLPRHNAIFANACASVAFDFDDYVFAGHTGHSAVCAAFAYGEAEGASGKDVLSAITVGNEVGARLGASLLFGPQNGQMWSYIHLLEGACVASRFVGNDAGKTANAIGVAFTQPPYALIPAFMGPDSKMLIPASTTVDGCRAAELAARGWTGSDVIIEDRQGFLRRFNENNLGWINSGYGDAWLSDTMTIKIVPGCAYIDTAVDAFGEIADRFENEHGRRPSPDDIAKIDIQCGLLTSGMEAFSSAYRSSDRLEPITINFSCALSIGLILVAGALAPEYLSHKHLDTNREAIEAVAAKITVTHSNEIDKRSSEASESKGFSLASVLSKKSLDGVSFESYVMAFPAEVTVGTTDGKEYVAVQDVPFGAAGRDWTETAEHARQKFRANYTGRDADAALQAIDDLENVSDVREIAALLASR